MQNDVEPCTNIGSAGFPSSWYLSWRSPFVGFDFFPPYQTQEAYLVSPSIDLSDAECVDLRWVEAFDGGTGSDKSELGALVEFSIDGGQNWRSPSLAINSPDVSTLYDRNYVINGRYNNEKREIPLLGAEGQKDVKIRFGFKGDFNFWIIDDIEITECSESLIHIPLSSLSTSHINPMSINQIDTVNFMLDLFNLTLNDYENINVKINAIDNEGIYAFSDSVGIQNFNSDTNARFIQLPRSFVPETSPKEFNFMYSLTDSNDNNLNNNAAEFSFRTINENVFRKEDGISSTSLSPNFSIDSFGKNNDRSWEMGNIFFVTNDISNEGYPYIFDHISFQLENYDDLTDVRLKIWLYKIEDKNFDFIISKDDNDEMATIGSAEYLIIGDEEGFVTTLLSPFPESENASRLILEKNTHYMAAVEYIHIPELSSVDMRISASTSDLYAAAYRTKRILSNGDLTKIRYAHGFLVNPQNHFRIGPADDPIEGNFDESLVPFIRLGYEPFLGVGLADLQLKDFQITPSPSSEFVNVSFELEEESEVQLSIIDLDGRTLLTMQTNWNENANIRFDVSNFSSGVYLLRVKTEQGQETKKIVVTK